MSRDQTATTDRREWINGVLRNGALGMIGAASLYMIARRTSDPCRESASGCRVCRSFSRCELPLARSVRSQRTGKERS